MSTITCERGDILLINVPIGEDLLMRLRPAMAMHDCSPLDPLVSIVPLTADPMVNCNSVLVPLGSFESARMGLVTSAYLNTVDEIAVPRQFLVQKIGRCPYRMLSQFLGMYRSSLGFSHPAGLSLTEQAANAVTGEVTSRPQLSGNSA
ncbi:MAG: hypothetical protein U5J83_08610 [Bryobacterales bacterium]|nr:hypothetical protein [Bryobacterales bacterium]